MGSDCCFNGISIVRYWRYQAQRSNLLSFWGILVIRYRTVSGQRKNTTGWGSILGGSRRWISSSEYPLWTRSLCNELTRAVGGVRRQHPIVGHSSRTNDGWLQSLRNWENMSDRARRGIDIDPCSRSEKMVSKHGIL